MTIITTETTRHGLHMSHWAADGPVILFLHTMWGGRWQFNAWLQFAWENGFDAYALDLRGRFGSRPCDIGRVRFLEFADDVAEGIGHTRTNPVVVGISYGGLLAQWAAYRGWARKAVFINTVPPRGIFLPWRTLLNFSKWEYAKKIFRDRPVKPSFEDTLAFGLKDYKNPEMLYNMLVPDSGRALREIALGGITIPSLACPAMIFSGSQDRIMTPPSQWRTATHYDIPVRTYMSHGHLMMLETHGKDWANPIRDILEFAS